MIRTNVELTTHYEPHLYHTAESLFGIDDLHRLNSELPDRSEFRRTVKEGAQHPKTYRMWLLTVFRDGAVTTAGEKLPPAWSELLTDATGTGVRKWLSAGTGIDLDESSLEVNICIRGPGDYRSVHPGKIGEKAIDANFVLNEQWPEDGGGSYELWESREAAGPARIVPARPGGMFTVIPTEISWHGVSPVRQHISGGLLTLALAYWKH